MTNTAFTALDRAALRVHVEELRAEFIRRTARRIGHGIANITRRIVRG